MNTLRLSLFIVLCHTLALIPEAAAQVYEKVFSFTEARAAELASIPNNGAQALAALVQGTDGDFYGTTADGGANGSGTVFKISRTGESTTLVEFTANGVFNKGALPAGSLIQATNGYFYGTTQYGGANGDGTVFRMTAAGQLTTLVQFTGNGATNKGELPYAGLVEGSDGNFYGTTVMGGATNKGTVFKMTPSGELTTLVEFTGIGGANPGSSPQGVLVQGGDGALYGTTFFGGVNDHGTVFKVTPAGALTTLVEFAGAASSNRGANPESGLIRGSDGNFYGTTHTLNGIYDAVSSINYGTIFRMTPAGQLTTLHEFNGFYPGGYLRSCVVEGPDGNFYGTTPDGGLTPSGTPSYHGTAFRMTPAGVVTKLVNFTGNGTSDKGSAPWAALVVGSDGNFYGTTREGGAKDLGTVFRMTPAGGLTTLLEFSGATASDLGYHPSGGVVQGSDGDLYGTTTRGGTNNVGTAFKVTPGGLLTTLVEFPGLDGTSLPGSYPSGGLIRGSDGNFYGTTFGGNGTVFRLPPTGGHTTLVEFSGNGATNKGSYPGHLVESDGAIYGLTGSGGPNDAGTVFKMTLSGSLSTLVQFSGNGATNKGSSPTSLILGSDGHFYGTAGRGGANNYGTVFKMTPDGLLTTLVEFNYIGAVTGAYPGVLVEGADGDFYGTTATGGAFNRGTLFRMTPEGVVTTLVEFTGDGATNKGMTPVDFVRGPDGNFYGTTQAGGANDKGTIFQVTPGGQLTTLFNFAAEVEDRVPNGLRVAPDGNIYGTTFASAGGSIYRIVFPGPPGVYPLPVEGQTSATALAQVKINPRGADTTVYLEYGSDDDSLSNIVTIGRNLNGYRMKLAGSGIDGLVAGQTYYFRFRATSSAGTTVSAVQSFSTLAEPVVTAAAASSVTATSATFNGTVNARSFETTVVFEWGTDGNSFPNVVGAEQGMITGSAAVPVSKAVAGLPEGGTVFFRLRAMNAGGTVTSGVRSFSTVSVTTSNPLPEQVGVTEAIFRATINTFGQTAAVKFRYWATATPALVSETATQLVTSNVAVEVTHREPTLLENISYSYQVSVELAGTETNGGPVTFTTDINEAPVALPDLVFYAGQVEIKPLENDTDPNSGSNAGLLLDTTLVTAPSVSLGVAGVNADRTTISYNPAFNVRDDDTLVYRVVDDPTYPASGQQATAQVRLIAFSKRAGLYSGRMVFGSEMTAREGQVAVQMGSSGIISTSFMAWPSMGAGVRESFVLKGQFDQQGRLARTLNSPSGAVLTLTLQLDADLPQIRGTFEERVNGTSTTGEVLFTLTKNGGTGGLAESGLRTGFLSPPPELAGVMSEGFVRMTVGKDARRGARFAGRLPDGEPFLASAKAQGRTYELTRKLEQGGLFTGLVRSIDSSEGAGGMMGDLYWQKRVSSRARFHRGGVETMLSVSGVAYPSIPRGGLPPMGLGGISPNARLRLSGGDFTGTYRDLLLNIMPGGVQIIGPDSSQAGFDVSLNKLQVKIDGPNGAFSGRFLHPATGKPVTFEGAFRAPFDGEPGQGRGVFRGPSAAGAVRIEAN